MKKMMDSNFRLSKISMPVNGIKYLKQIVVIVIIFVLVVIFIVLFMPFQNYYHEGYNEQNTNIGTINDSKYNATTCINISNNKYIPISSISKNDLIGLNSKDLDAFVMQIISSKNSSENIKTLIQNLTERIITNQNTSPLNVNDISTLLNKQIIEVLPDPNGSKLHTNITNIGDYLSDPSIIPSVTMDINERINKIPITVNNLPLPIVLFFIYQISKVKVIPSYANGKPIRNPITGDFIDPNTGISLSSPTISQSQSSNSTNFNKVCVQIIDQNICEDSNNQDPTSKYYQNKCSWNDVGKKCLNGPRKVVSCNEINIKNQCSTSDKDGYQCKWKNGKCKSNTKKNIGPGQEENDE